jgi:hypothetical protein
MTSPQMNRMAAIGAAKDHPVKRANGGSEP